MRGFCISLFAVLALMLWNPPARACPTVGLAGGYSQASFSQGFAAGPVCNQQQLLLAPAPAYGGCNTVGFAGAGYNAGFVGTGFVGVNRGFGFNLGVGFNRGFGRGFRSRTVIRTRGF